MLILAATPIGNLGDASRRLIEALGVDPDSGVLRMSFLHYTAEEEIERLIEGLESLCRARSGRA